MLTVAEVVGTERYLAGTRTLLDEPQALIRYSLVILLNSLRICGAVESLSAQKRTSYRTAELRH